MNIGKIPEIIIGYLFIPIGIVLIPTPVEQEPLSGWVNWDSSFVKNGVSSPHLIVWLGSYIEKAKE